MSKKKQRPRAERAAAALREQQRRERRRQDLTVVGVVAALALIVGGGFLVNSTRDTTEGRRRDASTARAASYGVTIGDDSAPRRGRHLRGLPLPVLRRVREQASREPLAALADDGKVQVEYRPFVLLSGIGDYSLRATTVCGRGARQAGPEVAKEFHDLLFENQPSEAGPFPSDDELVALAVEAGRGRGRRPGGG